MYEWLDSALDCGISELDFWNMTLAEVNRAIDSKIRMKKAEEKERASFDYILASIIAKGVQSSIVGGEGIPEITEIYSSLFTDDIEEKQIQKEKIKNDLSVSRFKQFVSLHNKKYEEVAKSK